MGSLNLKVQDGEFDKKVEGVAEDMGVDNILMEVVDMYLQVYLQTPL